MDKHAIQKAIEQLKQQKKRNFSQSFDLIINLKHFDPKANTLDLFITLPYPKSKKPKIACFVAQELREIMAMLGVKTINELIGRTGLLEIDKGVVPWKAGCIDYSGILYRPPLRENTRNFCVRANVHEIHNVMDKKLIKLARFMTN